MIQSKQKNLMRARRHARVRSRVVGTSVRPRLAVFRSNKYIYAQLVDDDAGQTLAATTDKGLKEGGAKAKGFTKVNKAYSAGEELAKLALKKNIKQVVFDRGGYLYSGRIKALSEGARAGGLVF